jgi:hypothetical protein
MTPMTPDAKRKFLKVLAAGSTVTTAARTAGVGPRTVYDNRNRDKEFAAAWDDALEAGTDVLEEIALKRAAEYSDVLLLALLKARRPDKYTDRQRLEHVRVDLTGAQQELEQLAVRILKDDEEKETKRLTHVPGKDAPDV